tara:strand:+ start:83 stop:280 length:198 start_codon:yes stop_codon:yes gene_type:complete
MIKNSNKIVNETVNALIDQLIIEEQLIDCMYESGDYNESDDGFALDKEYLTKKVILELYNRLKNQ